MMAALDHPVRNLNAVAQKFAVGASETFRLQTENAC